MSDLRLPDEWEKETGITIIDPDGWDRRNFEESWGTPITLAEFKERAFRSTIQGWF